MIMNFGSQGRQNIGYFVRIPNDILEDSQGVYKGLLDYFHTNPLHTWEEHVHRKRPVVIREMNLEKEAIAIENGDGIALAGLVSIVANRLKFIGKGSDETMFMLWVEVNGWNYKIVCAAFECEKGDNNEQ
jgi:hypothetical protein